MELLDRYLQAVRFWLPKAQQQDIIAELSSDLHSQIEDRETELGRPLHEAELEAILKKSGNPMLVASSYRPPTQLIGPALFPIYQFVLKVVLLWILLPVFLFIGGPLPITLVLTSPHRALAMLQTFGDWVRAEIFAAAIITVVFAVLERTQARLKLVDKWDIRSLPPVPKQPQPPSRIQSVFELVFAIIGLFWLLLVPVFSVSDPGTGRRFSQGVADVGQVLPAGCSARPAGSGAGLLQHCPPGFDLVSGLRTPDADGP